MVRAADRHGPEGMVHLLRPGFAHDHWRGVPREPVSTAIGLSSLLAGGIAAAGVGYVAAFAAGSAIGGALITGGVYLAANYAVNKVSGVGKTVPQAGGVGFVGASSINTPEARGTIRQAAAPQRIIYGRMGGIGGVWCFYDDATPPYQYITLMLCRGRISAIRSVTFNNRTITFAGGNDFDSILTPLAVTEYDYHQRLRASFRQGTEDQTKCPLLEDAFPASGADILYDAAGNVTNLPASFRQRGIACATFEAQFGDDREDFEARWGQVAYINPLIELDGAPLFDPRDPSQDIAAEETYKFTWNGSDVGRNPSLIAAHWLTRPYGGRLSTDQIRLDELADAANYDDEIVHDIAGNPRPRHRADGVVLLNENPRHVTEAILTANRAWIVQSRGRVGWVADRPRDPVATLTERDILAGFDFQFGRRKRESFNRVRTRFTSPAKGYVEDDGPVHDRADLRSAKDNGELFDTTVRLPFTTDHRGVQWLSQQFLEESRLDASLELPSIAISRKTLKLRTGDVVRVAHRRYPEIDGIYIIVKDGFGADFATLFFSLKKYDKAISAAARGADEIEYQVAA